MATGILLFALRYFEFHDDGSLLLSATRYLNIFWRQYAIHSMHSSSCKSWTYVYAVYYL